MNRPDLAAAATFELTQREKSYPDQVKAGTRSADEAGRSLAAWRAIAEILHRGTATFEACLGETPAEAWPHLVEAAALATEHRLHRALIKNSPEAELRMIAAREIRDLMMRSAIRQGAQLPSFDQQEPKAKAA